MAKRLQVYRYKLIARERIGGGAISGGQEFFGVLVKDAQCGGVGCIHPWPCFGDAALEEELAALARGRPLRLGARALACAEADSRARQEGRSLFDGITIPPSHYLWGGEELGRQAEEVAAGGYSAVKLKVGGDPKAVFTHLTEVAELVEVPLRLDFNAALTASEARGLFRSLGTDLRRRIDLVEDPCPYDSDGWQALAEETGIDLALDWGFEAGLEQGVLPPGVALGVFKPARDDGEKLGAHPVLVTSSMDHPIGQMWAAWWAARVASGLVPGVTARGCGLLTHGHFCGDPALDLVRQEGSRLLPPAGTGVGFDDYLEELAWEDLK